SSAQPSGRRTPRISSRLPASCRQATHVLTGPAPSPALGRDFPLNGEGSCTFANRLAIAVAGLDVDPEAGELRGQARVLPIAADRERELVAGEDRKAHV